MHKKKLFAALVTISLFYSHLSAQNNTNSPYTRYGYGSVNESYSSEQKGMGGVSLSNRNSRSINTVNPASYSSVDSLKFMFDISATALYSTFTDQYGSSSKFNGNLEYVTLQFPIAKKIGVSAGLIPYSFSGYDFSSSQSLTTANGDTVNLTKNFSGKGGFSQVYLGLSTELFRHLSVGINGYYMYGSLENYRNLAFTSTNYTSSTQTNQITASNFRLRYGVQLYNTFAKKHDVILGVIYEMKKGLGGSFMQVNTSTTTDTLKTLGENSFELPTIMGAGLSYSYDKRFTVGADYSMYKWADTKFYGKTDSLNNVSKISVGAQFIPKPESRKFFERINYRAGFNISDSYFKTPHNGTNAKNIGVSLGLGIPVYSRMTYQTSMINTTIEYGKIGGDNSLLKESYLKLSLNFVFNENWFMKRKL